MLARSFAVSFAREFLRSGRNDEREIAAETHRSRPLRDYSNGNSRRKHGRHSGKSAFPNFPVLPCPFSLRHPSRPLFQTDLLFNRAKGRRENSRLTTLARGRNENATAKLPISSPWISLPRLLLLPTTVFPSNREERKIVGNGIDLFFQPQNRPGWRASGFRAAIRKRRVSER